jgi:hypothetical protein
MRLRFLLIAGAALAAAFTSSQARAEPHPIAKPNTPAVNASHDRDVTLDEYRAHLAALGAIVDACAKARDAKSCDLELVGGNDLVPLGNGANAERRPVRYNWLRLLLLKAQKPDEPVEKTKPPTGQQQSQAQLLLHQPQPPTSQLLEAAKTRLARDLAQIDNKPVTVAPHPAERAGLKKILAGREFADLEEQTPKDSFLEKLGNWINKVFGFLGTVTEGASWIGLAVKIGFIVLVCVGLVWGLLQLERRWRVRLIPEMGNMPAPGAASARDWQLWLKDARSSATAGQWREAIHFAYWAAISRLESKRLWPADRARTPREYLALVGADDARKPGLASLTSSFERTWYGGRAASETDYRAAEQLAEKLIAGASNTGATEGGAE